MLTRSLTVVQLNDVHGYLDLHPELFWRGGQATYRPAGGYARIASVLREIRAEQGDRVLVADGGDTLHGTYPAVHSKGSALVPILNALGIDAMTGHWDFAYGPKVLKQRVSQLSYPLVASNVYEKESESLCFPPHIVHEVAGLRVGIVGIASNIVDKTMPPSFSSGLRFTLGRDELPGAIERLRSHERVDLVVLLSHLGFPQDLQLLSEVSGVDVCLSAHTHNRLYHPVVQNGTLVIQSGAHGSFIGRLDLEVSGGRVVDYSHRLIPVEETIVPDPEVETLVRDAIAPYQSHLSEVIGETAMPIHRYTSMESSMDDVLLAAIQQHTDSQLAFSNGWRYGVPIVPGTITLNDLYNIIPMDPPISTVELTGLELVTMLEENLERTFSRDPFNQMGGFVKRARGMHAYIRIENPAGHRIQQLFVGQEEVRARTTYSASFVTMQGVPPEYGRNRHNLPKHAIDALREYFASHSPVSVQSTASFVAI